MTDPAIARRNLQEGLVAELARVRDQVIPAYQSIGRNGAFALALIREDLKKADDALAAGDVLQMLLAFKALEGIEA